MNESATADELTLSKENYYRFVNSGKRQRGSMIKWANLTINVWIPYLLKSNVSIDLQATDKSMCLYIYETYL